jgi:outer membrane protein OmpA-like peptidoglycan-associated protein
MRTCLFILCIVALCFIPTGINAQIDVKGKVKDKSINRADQRTDEGIDRGLDAVEEGVKNMFKKKEKSDDSESENEEESEPSDSEDSKPASSAKPKPAQDAPAKLTSYTKYDFVPGDQVILYEDFSQDEIGDFPALWTTNGSGEVRTLNNYQGKWLFMNTADRVYNLMKDLTLPDNFILEFDVIPVGSQDNDENSSFYLTMYNGSGEFLNDDLYPGLGGVHVTCNNYGWNVMGYKEGANESTRGESELAPLETNKMNHVIMWVQKRRLRIYHKGQKVIDLPTVLYDGITYNRFRLSLWSQEGYPYMTNIRFTSAKPDMRSKLLTEGKIVSYGIYFDVNSDKLKPESYGTLKEIAQVLSENPTVKIKIVGHTDGDGDAAKNLDLSKRRAASVKAELAATFGIAGARIETDGKGKTEPVAANDTPANKAKNRRVEFIKL